MLNDAVGNDNEECRSENEATQRNYTRLKNAGIIYKLTVELILCFNY